MNFVIPRALTRVARKILKFIFSWAFSRAATVQANFGVWVFFFFNGALTARATSSLWPSTWPARLTPVALGLATTEKLPTTTTIKFDWRGGRVGLRDAWNVLANFLTITQSAALRWLYLSDTDATVSPWTEIPFVLVLRFAGCLYTLSTGRLHFRNCLPRPGLVCPAPPCSARL